MSGTIRYKLDARTSSATPAENNSDWFVSLYKYFQLQVASGQATIHASNFGNSGTGFDRHDEANPVGENAFFVVKMLASASTIRTNDYYLLFQWADASGFGSSPGNPGKIDNGSGDGVGVAMAYRADGGDPWNGTTLANGTDTKGTPVWVDGGSDLVMFHADNKAGGGSATNKEDLHRLEDFSAGTHRGHIMGDADATFIWFDQDDDGTSIHTHYIGAYEPIAGAAIDNPLIHMSFDGAGVPSYLNVFDSASGCEGQMCGSDDTDSYDYNLTNGIFGLHNEVIHQPSDQGGTIRYVDCPVFIIQRTGPDSGLAGNMIKQLVGHVFNVPLNSSNAALTRAYLAGSSPLNTLKWSVAWAGASPPGTGSGRDGVEV